MKCLPQTPKLWSQRITWIMKTCRTQGIFFMATHKSYQKRWPCHLRHLRKLLNDDLTFFALIKSGHSWLGSCFYTQPGTVQVWGRVWDAQLITRFLSAISLVNTADILNHELSPPILTQLLHYDVFFLGKKETWGEKGLYPKNHVVRVSEELITLKLKAKDKSVTQSLSWLKTLILGSPWMFFCINFYF